MNITGKSKKIPTKDDLKSVDNSSNREAANQVRYIPTNVKIRSQYKYKTAIGTKASGMIINSNNPDSILI